MTPEEIGKALAHTEALRLAVVRIREHLETSNSDNPLLEKPGVDAAICTVPYCREFGLAYPVCMDIESGYGSVRGFPAGLTPTTFAQFNPRPQGLTDDEWRDSVNTAKMYGVQLLRQWEIELAKGRCWSFDDGWGMRTLYAPIRDSGWVGSPVDIVRDIEAKTRTRLKDGENPMFLWRFHDHFTTSREPEAKMTFAEFCQRRHPEKIDPAPPLPFNGAVSKNTATDKPRRCPCPTCGEYIAVAALKCIHCGERTGWNPPLEQGTPEVMSTTTTTIVEPADGPQPPNKFRWKGKTAELAPLPYRMVEWLFQQTNRTAKVDDVIEYVFHGRNEPQSGIDNHKNSANRAFERAEMPIRIAPSNGYVTLEIGD